MAGQGGHTRVLTRGTLRANRPRWRGAVLYLLVLAASLVLAWRLTAVTGRETKGAAQAPESWDRAVVARVIGVDAGTMTASSVAATECDGHEGWRLTCQWPAGGNQDAGHAVVIWDRVKTYVVEATVDWSSPASGSANHDLDALATEFLSTRIKGWRQDDRAIRVYADAAKACFKWERGAGELFTGARSALHLERPSGRLKRFMEYRPPEKLVEPLISREQARQIALKKIGRRSQVPLTVIEQRLYLAFAAQPAEGPLWSLLIARRADARPEQADYLVSIDAVSGAVRLATH